MARKGWHGWAITDYPFTEAEQVILAGQLKAEAEAETVRKNAARKAEELRVAKKQAADLYAKYQADLFEAIKASGYKHMTVKCKVSGYRYEYEIDEGTIRWEGKAYEAVFTGETFKRLVGFGQTVSLDDASCDDEFGYECGYVTIGITCTRDIPVLPAEDAKAYITQKAQERLNRLDDADTMDDGDEELSVIETDMMNFTLNVGSSDLKLVEFEILHGAP
jgi:hypothetical protein